MHRLLVYRRLDSRRLESLRLPELLQSTYTNSFNKPIVTLGPLSNYYSLSQLTARTKLVCPVGSKTFIVMEVTKDAFLESSIMLFCRFAHDLFLESSKSVPLPFRDLDGQK